MKSRVTLSLLLICFAVFVFEACKKENDENETNISSFNDTESHNMGQNCMNCHKSGGSGEGWFNAAGTVYDSLGTAVYPNALVELYSGPNGSGTKKYSIEVDGKGNFYTTEDINFGSGLYPSIKGSIVTKHMATAITTGQCNSCHGNSTGKLWTK